MRFNYLDNLVKEVLAEAKRPIVRIANTLSSAVDDITTVDEMSRFLTLTSKFLGANNETVILDKLIENISGGMDEATALAIAKKEYAEASGKTTQKSDIEKKYDIFKAEYDKATGKSWTFEKFKQRAADWKFYGDDQGFVAVRFQKSGYVKLTGAAGNMRSKLRGLKQLLDENMPLWGLVSPQIAELAGKVGFIAPPQFIVNQIIKHIDPSVLAGANVQVNDGSVVVDYKDVGTVEKKLIVTKPYLKKLLESKQIPMSGVVVNMIKAFL